MASILVVDDEVTLLELLANLMEDLGHKAFTASDGKQALKIVASEPIDLIISDIMMPVMDGLTFLRHLKENSAYQDIKVILMSAAPLRQENIQPDKYMPKPYNLDDMEAAVAEMLES
jgi:CheY-like chemotaxis protein